MSAKDIDNLIFGGAIICCALLVVAFITVPIFVANWVNSTTTQLDQVANSHTGEYQGYTTYVHPAFLTSYTVYVIQISGKPYECAAGGLYGLNDTAIFILKNLSIGKNITLGGLCTPLVQDDLYTQKSTQ